ncbi:hypothetical protein HDV05_002302, partial [Chytridiales sp. JEL 0842]
MERSVAAYISILGILKAGAAYVPVDPQVPEHRKALIFDDVNARVVICSKAVSEALSKDESATRSYMVVDGDYYRRPPPNLSIHINIPPTNLAYAIYTSGTTGTPKGCLIEHGSACKALESFKKSVPVKSDSRFLQFASFAFDVSISEMFLCWLVGGTLVSVPADEALGNLEATISACNITVTGLTPTVAALVRPVNVPNLQVLASGGEKMTQKLLDTWAKTGKLFNAYGPSETTIGVSICKMLPDHRPSILGRCYDSVSAYILSDDLDILPRGCVGELCLGGPQVARGYLNRENQTTTRFVFVHGIEERLYRTGDLARMLHDGTLEYLGRKDNQVKLNGLRIELDEVSSVIRSCDVSDATTL